MDPFRNTLRFKLINVVKRKLENPSQKYTNIFIISSAWKEIKCRFVLRHYHATFNRRRSSILKYGQPQSKSLYFL